MSKVEDERLTVTRPFLYARTAVIVAVFAVMFLVGCTKEKVSQQSNVVECGFPSGTVIYAIKDIPEGEIISAKALEPREIQLTRIPQDAVSMTGGRVKIVGRITKSRILAGQIIRYEDLLPEYGSAENTIMLSKEEQEQLERIASESHTPSKVLLKTWVLEHLKK